MESTHTNKIIYIFDKVCMFIFERNKKLKRAMLAGIVLIIVASNDDVIAMHTKVWKFQKQLGMLKFYSSYECK